MNGGGAVQSLSHGQLFAIPWTASRQAPLSFMISWSLLKPMSIESAMPSNHLTLCRPLLPSIFPSIRVFSTELALQIRWPKYWSFSFTISPSSEYSRLISLKIDWFDFLPVRGAFRSLLLTNLDSVLKSRGITLPGKAHIVKAIISPVVTYGCESWMVKTLTGMRNKILSCLHHC